MKILWKCSLVFALVCLCAGPVFAVPRELPYEGQLYDGTFLTGGSSGQTQKFYFTIYTASTGGAVLWQSGVVTTFVRNGFVSLSLGDASMTPLPESIFDAKRELWLHVQTAPLANSLVTLTPRKKIMCAAFSFDSDRLGGVAAAEYMRKWTNVIVVGVGGPIGGADYDDIGAAIVDAGSRATAANRYTVFVLPGIYSGGFGSAQYVDVIGLDRDNCIVTGTYTISHSVLIENITFNVGGGAPQAISIQSGAPAINNVRIFGGASGIDVQPSASDATIHNVEISSGVAVNDQLGVTIDGLRSYGSAFQVTSIGPPVTINYKNIIQSGGGNLGSITGDVSGTIRSLKGDATLSIAQCTDLRIRDVHIFSEAAEALNVQFVSEALEVFDGYFASSVEGMGVAQIGSQTDPDLISGAVLFNDVRFNGFGVTTDGIQAFFITNVTVEDCEIDVSNYGINCMLNDSGNAAAQLYVQTTWIRSGSDGINLGGATELWLYDTTIYNTSGNSVFGNAALTPQPRIADCRLETDTSPSQGVGGAPGWNAFGGLGNAGGTGEDTRGNLVAPTPGTPVSP